MRNRVLKMEFWGVLVFEKKVEVVEFIKEGVKVESGMLLKGREESFVM